MWSWPTAFAVLSIFFFLSNVYFPLRNDFLCPRAVLNKHNITTIPINVTMTKTDVSPQNASHHQQHWRIPHGGRRLQWGFNKSNKTKSKWTKEKTCWLGAWQQGDLWPSYRGCCSQRELLQAWLSFFPCLSTETGQDTGNHRAAGVLTKPTGKWHTPHIISSCWTSDRHVTQVSSRSQVIFSCQVTFPRPKRLQSHLQYLVTLLVLMMTLLTSLFNMYKKNKNKEK